MSNEYYSFLFQQEGEVTVAFFTTKTGVGYRVYFYPASEYIDKLESETILYKNGFFFGFTKLAEFENRAESLDIRIRNTILIVINSFYEEKGIDKILIFYCDDDDGKKQKRFACFDRWYMGASTKTCFKKIDEVIIIADETGAQVDVEYLSLILECNNPQFELIQSEFQALKESLISGK